MDVIPALEITHLTVSYDTAIVVSDLSVTIPSGIMLGIIGPNGAGKTTCMKAMLGLIPSSGMIKILGKSVIDARKNIAYVPQKNAVDWDFPATVFDVVLMGCYGKLGWFKRPRKQDHMNAYEALATVGLEHVAHHSIGALSGGQQQRVFLARALMSNAQIFFLDEPFAGVDAITEKIIITLFKKLRDEGKTIIVVHHDLHTAPAYFDWALLLNKHCIAVGPVDDVLTKQYLDCVYEK